MNNQTKTFSVSHSYLVVGSLAASLAFALLVPGSARAQSTGQLTISQSTVLTEDHVGEIDIVADGVELDCAGHRVSIGNAGTYAGIHVAGRSNVAIRNCVVEGYELGIWLSGTAYSKAENNTMIDNERAISVRNGGYNEVLDNVIRGSTSEHHSGIIGDDSRDLLISGNTIEGMSSTGIVSYWTPGARIQFNTVRDSGGGAILKYTQDIEFHGNQMLDNRDYGLFVQRCDLTTVSGNLAVGTGGSGYRFDAVDDLTVSGNSALNGGTRGFEFLEVEGFEMTGNLATGQAGIGMAFERSSQGVVQFNSASWNAVVDARQTDGTETQFFANVFPTSEGIP